MPRWTPEAREKQSQAIRSWKPWTESTGPRTEDGKAISSANADKGGVRPYLRDVLKTLRRLEEALDKYESDDS